MFAIENDHLIVKAKEAGAELTSIVSRHTTLECLWQAEEIWPQHAPVLFPIVGQLKENTYYYNGNAYPLGRHGFARTKHFKVVEHKKEEIHFLLEADDETLKSYPFHFEFSIRYLLNDKKLKVVYEVKNKGDGKMLFSVGGNPGFRVPLHKHESYDDYRLEFNRIESAERYYLEKGLLSGHKEFILENDSVIHLTKSLFYKDALVFKNLQSSQITLCSNKYSNGLHFYFENFPYFGIWSAKDADYVCLEPWHGIADSTAHNEQLEDKEGILSLDPAKSFTCEYAIEPF